MAAELPRLGWNEVDLEGCRRDDPDKLEIAARFRRQTALSVKEIAALMRLGASKEASRNLHIRVGRGSPPATGQAAPWVRGRKVDASLFSGFVFPGLKPGKTKPEKREAGVWWRPPRAAARLRCAPAGFALG
jgi:hypothetical protein